MKFGLVGLSGVLVRLVCFQIGFSFLFALFEESIRFTSANAFGFVVSVFTNFILNDWWTWGDRRKGGLGHWARRVGKYYISASVAGAIDLVVAEVTLRWLVKPWLQGSGILAFIRDAVNSVVGLQLAVGPVIAVCLGIGSGMFVNFLASHYWAFREQV